MSFWTVRILRALFDRARPSPSGRRASRRSSSPRGRSFSPGCEALEAREVPNASPIAAADSYTVHQGKVVDDLMPGVLRNDSDPDGNPLTASLVSGPINGTLTLNQQGRMFYRPRAGFVGSDSFTYRVSDGYGGTDDATVTLAVTNAAPVAGPWEDYTTAVNTNFSVAAPGLIGNDVDADGDKLYPVLSAPVPSGQAYITANGGKLWLSYTGSFVYKPPVNWSGVDTFEYRAFDGAEYSAPVTVRIAVGVPMPPPPLPTVTVETAANPAEGGDDGSFVFHRTGWDVSQPLTVTFRIGSNGVTPESTWGDDFTLAGSGLFNSGANLFTVTFGAGQTDAGVGVHAVTDELIEGSEGFLVTLLDGETYQAGTSGGSSLETTADLRILDLTATDSWEWDGIPIDVTVMDDAPPTTEPTVGAEPAPPAAATWTLEQVMRELSQSSDAKAILDAAIKDGVKFETTSGKQFGGSFDSVNKVLAIDTDKNPNLVIATSTMLYELQRYKFSREQLDLDKKARAGMLTKTQYADACEALSYKYIKEHHAIAEKAVNDGKWLASVDSYKADLAGAFSTEAKFIEEMKKVGHYKVHEDNYDILRVQ